MPDITSPTLALPHQDRTGGTDLLPLPLPGNGRNMMADLLRPDAFENTAFEGRELVETPGLAATLDVKAASVLSDQQLVAFGSAGCSSMPPSTRH
jgi:hypothetical protein